MVIRFHGAPLNFAPKVDTFASLESGRKAIQMMGLITKWSVGTGLVCTFFVVFYGAGTDMTLVGGL